MSEKSQVPDWHVNDLLNEDPAKSGSPEGMKRSDVNDRAREVQGAIRRYYADPEWLDLARDDDSVPLTVTAVGAPDFDTVRIENFDRTDVATDGRRVRMWSSAAPGVYTYAHILSSVFSGVHTDVTCETFSGDESQVPGACDRLEFNAGATLGKLAFVDTQGFGFYLPPTNDDVGLQTAIDAAAASSNGIVLLSGAYTIRNTVTIKTNVTVYGGSHAGSLVTAAGTLAGSVFEMEGRSALYGTSITTFGAAAGPYDTIQVLIGADRVDIHDVRIVNSTRHAIGVGSDCVDISIANVGIWDPRQSGINIEDANDLNRRITIDNVTIDDPGADLTTVDVAGISVKGQAALSNITATLDRNSPTKPRGVWFRSSTLGADRGWLATLTGLRVTGSGSLAIGLEVGGERCSVTGGTIELGGSTSRGILFDATGDGSAISKFNQVSDVFIEDADIGISMTADAHDNIVSGCKVLNPVTTALNEAGDRNVVSHCHFESAATGVGVNITIDASDCRMQKSTIRNFADAVTFAGPGDNWIEGCEIIDCVDGIVSGTDSHNRVWRCHFHGVTNIDPNGPIDHHDIWNENTSDAGELVLSSNQKQAVQTANGSIFTSAGGPFPVRSDAKHIRLPGPVPDGNAWWRFREAGIENQLTGNWTMGLYTSATPRVSTRLVYASSFVAPGGGPAAWYVPGDGQPNMSLPTPGAQAFVRDGWAYFKPGAGEIYVGAFITFIAPNHEPFQNSTDFMDPDVFLEAQYVGYDISARSDIGFATETP